MIQYKILFYRKGFAAPAANYYREFETYTDAKEWAKYTLNDDSLYSRYSIIEIELSEFLENQ